MTCPAPRSLFALVLVSASALLACGSPPYEVEVEPSLTNCTGIDDTLCFELTQDGERGLHYEEIEDFEYRWCHRARLLIRDEPVPNPPADASSVRYVLVEELEVTEVPGHETTLTLFDEWKQGGEIGPLDFTPRCADDDTALCDDLMAALEDDGVDRVEATFRCEEDEATPRLVSFEEPEAE